MSLTMEDAARFKAAKQRATEYARQRTALQLALGLDIDAAMTASPTERMTLMARVDRQLRRERLKGLNRSWSYDLNRHIALKQVLDRLKREGPATADVAPCP